MPTPLHLQAFLQPTGVMPQFLQKSLHLSVAIMPGGQLVPQDLRHCDSLHFTGSYLVAPGIHGQQALVPDDMVMVTVVPFVIVQVLASPIAPITVRGVAIIEPRITGGA